MEKDIIGVSVLERAVPKFSTEEMDKLWKHLKLCGYNCIAFRRCSPEGIYDQIRVYDDVSDDEGLEPDWDAICFYGSFGYEEGLLEIYGNIVDPDKDGDSVVGHLTAADIMERLRLYEKEKTK